MKLLYILKYDPSLNSKSPIYDFMDFNVTQFYTLLGINK
jgi:hypothetical protein